MLGWGPFQEWKLACEKFLKMEKRCFSFLYCSYLSIWHDRFWKFCCHSHKWTHYFRKVAPRAQNSAWKPPSLHLVVLFLLIAVPLGWSVRVVLPTLDFEDWLETHIRMESSYLALSQTAASVSSGSEHAPYKGTIVNKLEQILACIKHFINITNLPFTMNIFPF